MSEDAQKEAVAGVVVNYNAKEYLLQCVGSLLARGRGAGSCGGQRFYRRLRDGTAGALSRGQMGADGRQPRLWHSRQHRRRRGATARTCSYATPTWWWARARSRSCGASSKGALTSPSSALACRRVRRCPVPLGPALPRPPRGVRARDPRPVLGRQPVFAPLPDGGLGPRQGSQGRLGLGRMLPRPPQRPGRPWAASTGPTSCTWRTSTCAGASPRPDGRLRTSRPRRSSTPRACRPTATPTGCCFAHHVSMWRFARRTDARPSALAAPVGPARPGCQVRPDGGPPSPGGAGLASLRGPGRAARGKAR